MQCSLLVKMSPAPYIYCHEKTSLLTFSLCPWCNHRPSVFCCQPRTCYAHNQRHWCKIVQEYVHKWNSKSTLHRWFSYSFGAQGLNFSLQDETSCAFSSPYFKTSDLVNIYCLFFSNASVYN